MTESIPIYFNKSNLQNCFSESILPQDLLQKK